jgi:hypothetical protein
MLKDEGREEAGPKSVQPFLVIGLVVMLWVVLL